MFDYIPNGDSREFHIKGTKIGFSENGLLRSAYFGYMELEVEERTSNNTLRSVRPGLDFYISGLGLKKAGPSNLA